MTVLMALSAVAMVYTVYWMRRERKSGHMDEVFAALGFFFFFAALFFDSILQQGPLFMLPGVIEVPLRVFTLVLVVGFVYAFNQMRAFTRENEAQKHPKLVRSGIYAYLRHPVYLGAIMWVVLAFVLSPTVVRAIMLPVSTASFLLAAKLEDKMNLEKFGREFIRYQEEIPGFNALAAVGAWVRKR